MIDLRSDTVTQPTAQMREAMMNCEVGDDVCGEDPTLNGLEAYAAELLGKEAALFTPSGTFANQCAILTHTRSGNEMIVCEDSHIIQHEAGSTALISRAQTRSIRPANGWCMSLAEIDARIRKEEDIHYPDTGLICLEQALANGRVIPFELMQEIRELALRWSVPVHIDGARLFNAACALDKQPAQLAALCDSVSVCLSKGLCAPVGSVLAGSADFIAAARQNRKIMGGGMRQAGILGAAGLVAFQTMRDRLATDHENALLLAHLLEAVNGLRIVHPPEINMVFLKVEQEGMDEAEFVRRLEERGVLTFPPEGGELRFVMHHGIDEEQVQYCARAMKEVLAL